MSKVLEKLATLYPEEFKQEYEIYKALIEIREIVNNATFTSMNNAIYIAPEEGFIYNHKENKNVNKSKRTKKRNTKKNARKVSR